MLCVRYLEKKIFLLGVYRCFFFFLGRGERVIFEFRDFFYFRFVFWGGGEVGEVGVVFLVLFELFGL